MEILEKLETMGTRGAYAALGIAALLVLTAVALAGLSFWLEGAWGTLGLRGLAFASVLASMLFGMVGAKGLQPSPYGSASDAFPSMGRDEFLLTVDTADRPVCVCAACFIAIPAHFSTGSCPVCASAVDYYEINTDEDAQMIRSAIS